MLDDAGFSPSIELDREEASPTQALGSATLDRLIAEVRHAGTVQPTAYNRMHNRHNRS